MSEHQIHALFQSDTVRVDDFHCQGVRASHSDEECTERHEIVLLRSGAFVRYDSSGLSVADVNHILFFHENQPYRIAHPVPGGDYSTIFGIQSAALYDMLRVYDPHVDDRPDKPFPASYALVDTRQRLVQYQLLQTAFRSHTAESLDVEERILMLLAQFIQHVHDDPIRPIPSRNAATVRLHRDIADQVKVILARRLGEKINLSQIAADVNVSPYFLCRLFKREARLSIHRYLLRLRLLNALEQLAEQPEDNLATLALNLGFSSHSHLSTAFLREFGVTPSEFRLTVTGRALRKMSKILKA